MAICYFNFTSNARSKGNSSVSKAAYIRGAQMVDERTNTSYNYAKRSDVAFTDILIPDNSPQWIKVLVKPEIPAHLDQNQKAKLLKDNQDLASNIIWNMSEKKSLKSNARTGNNIILALPHELTIEQNIDLVRDFVNETYVSKGMLADMAIHEDTGNLHAHIILSNRELTDEGFGAVNKSWNSTSFIYAQRKSWADHQNKHLALNGIDERVDHRSYKDQNIELVPMVHEGASRHKRSTKDRVIQNNEIRQENYERIIKNPAIALDALSRSKLIFNMGDLEKLAVRYSANDDQYNTLLNALTKSLDLVPVVDRKDEYTFRATLLGVEALIPESIAPTRDAVLNDRTLEELNKELVIHEPDLPDSPTNSSTETGHELAPQFSPCSALPHDSSFASASSQMMPASAVEANTENHNRTASSGVEMIPCSALPPEEILSGSTPKNNNPTSAKSSLQTNSSSPTNNATAQGLNALPTAIPENSLSSRLSYIQLLAYPSRALEALFEKQGTFTRNDLAKFTLEYAADEGQFKVLFNAIIRSPELVEIGMVDGIKTYTARSAYVIGMASPATPPPTPPVSSISSTPLDLLAPAGTKSRLDVIAAEVIEGIQTNNSLFNDLDIGKALAKYNLTHEDYLATANKIKVSADVFYIGVWIDGRDTYTTQRLFKIECGIQDMTDELHATPHLKISNAERARLLEAWQNSKPKDRQLKDEQYAAALHMLNQDHSLACVIGRAGTGKSYTLKAVREIFEQLGVSVYGLALQGVAADGLARDGIDARTIASFKIAVQEGNLDLKAGDVLMVDEAGMVDSESMQFVMRVAHEYQLKLIPVGDPNQLAPVGSGAPFKWMVDRVPAKSITKVQRQQIDWQIEATEYLSEFKLREGLGAYDKHGDIYYGANAEETINALVSELITHWEGTGLDISEYHIMAFKNEEVSLFNEAIRAARVRKGEVSEGYRVEVKLREARAAKAWGAAGGKKFIKIAKADRILFLENNKKMGVRNGNFGTVDSVDFTEKGDVIRFNVKLDGAGIVTIDPKQFQKFDLGYAATVHNSQGMTKLYTWAYDNMSGWLRNLLYVAASRHKWSFRLFTTQKDLDSLVETMSRCSLKDSTLSFPWMFAQARGFEPEQMNREFVVTLHDKLRAGLEEVLARFEAQFKPRQQQVEVEQKQSAPETQAKSYSPEHEQEMQVRENARLIARYADVNREVGKTCEALEEKMAEFGLTELQYDTLKFKLIVATEAYQKREAVFIERDALAFEIMKAPDKYARALNEVYNFKEEKLKAQAESHAKRLLVMQYKDALEQGKDIIRDKLANQINLDVKGHFRAIQSLSLDVKALYQHAEAYRDRVFLLGLNKSEREGFKLVRAYQIVNRAVYAKMKAMPDIENEKGEIGAYSLTEGLTAMKAERERLAHQIALCLPNCDRSLAYYGIGGESTEFAALMAVRAQRTHEQATLQGVARLDAAVMNWDSSKEAAWLDDYRTSQELEKLNQKRKNNERQLKPEATPQEVEQQEQKHWYRMLGYASGERVRERLNQYQVAVREGDQANRLTLAAEMQEEHKFTWHEAIARGGEAFWQQIQQDAKAHAFEEKIAALTPEEQSAHRVVNEYRAARALYGKVWGEIVNLKATRESVMPEVEYRKVRLYRAYDAKQQALSDWVADPWVIKGRGAVYYVDVAESLLDKGFKEISLNGVIHYQPESVAAVAVALSRRPALPVKVKSTQKDWEKTVKRPMTPEAHIRNREVTRSDRLFNTATAEALKPAESGRGKLAQQIAANRAVYEPLLAQYEIEIDDVIKQAERYTERERVLRYAEELKAGRIVHRDRLAAEIAQAMRGHFAAIKSLDLDVKGIQQQARAHEDRVFMVGLSIDERQGFRWVRQYQALNRALYEKMKTLPGFDDDKKEKKNLKEMGAYSISVEMKALIAEREVMAHRIMQNTDLCDKGLTYFGLGSAASDSATLMALRAQRTHEQATLQGIARLDAAAMNWDTSKDADWLDEYRTAEELEKIVSQKQKDARALKPETTLQAEEEAKQKRWYRLLSHATPVIARERLEAYALAVRDNDPSQRLHLAHEINLESRMHYRLIMETGGEALLKQIQQDAKTWLFEAKVASMTLDEQAAYRVVNDYIEAKAACGRAWGEVFESQAVLKSVLPSVGYKKVRLYRAGGEEWAQSYEAAAMKQGQVFYLDVSEWDLKKGFKEVKTPQGSAFIADSSRAQAITLGRREVPSREEAAILAKTFDTNAFFEKVTPVMKPLTAVRTALAHTLYTNPDLYRAAMTDLKIDLAKLQQESDKEAHALVVQQYQTGETFEARALAAKTICADLSLYSKALRSAGVELKELYQAARVGERIEIFSKANATERQLLRDLDEYKNAGQKSGALWSRFFEDKNKQAAAGLDEQPLESALLGDSSEKSSLKISPKCVDTKGLPASSGSTQNIASDAQHWGAKRDQYAARIYQAIETIQICQRLEPGYASEDAQDFIHKGSRFNRQVYPLKLDQIKKYALRHAERVAIAEEWKAGWPKMTKAMATIAQVKTVKELAIYRDEIFMPAVNELKALLQRIKKVDEFGYAFREVGISPERFIKDQEALKQIKADFKELSERFSLQSSYPELASDDIERIQKAQRLVRESVPIEGTIGERYLRELRGITSPLSASCRFHPKLYVGGRNVPGIIFVGQPVDEKLGVTVIQAIHLDPVTGKKVDFSYTNKKTGVLEKALAKRSFGRFLPGAAILIQQGTGSQVAIAEGPETAYSIAMADPALTVYAVLGASNLQKVKLPKDVTEVILCADYDGVDAGSEKLVQAAAVHYAKQGVNVFRIIPAGRNGKEDFNDVLLKEGIDAVKAYLAAPELLVQGRSIVDVAKDIRNQAQEFVVEPAVIKKDPLTLQAEQYMSRIRKIIPIMKAAPGDKELHYEKGKEVYHLTCTMLDNPEFSQHVAEHLPEAHQYLQKIKVVFANEGLIALFESKSKAEAQKMIRKVNKEITLFEQSDNQLKRYHLGSKINQLVNEAGKDFFVHHQLGKMKSYARLEQKMLPVNEFMEATNTRLENQMNRLVKGMRQNFDIVNDVKLKREVRLKNGRIICTQLHNLKSDELLQFYMKDKTVENRYLQDTGEKLEKMNVIKAVQQQVNREAERFLQTLAIHAKVLDKPLVTGEDYSEYRKVRHYIDRMLSDSLMKDHIASEMPERYGAVQRVIELTTSALTQHENRMSQKIKGHVEAIKGNVAVINIPTLDMETRMEKVRDVYTYILLATRDPVLKDHLASRMVADKDYIERLSKVLDERKWTEALNKKALMHVEQVILIYKETDRELNTRPNKSRDEEIVKNLYINLREVLADPVIRNQLELKHPDQLKIFESRLARSSIRGEKYELQAKEQAEAAIAAYAELHKLSKDGKDDEKTEKMRLLYKTIKQAYSDPLVKLHLKEREPEAYKKFEQTMNYFMKENRHTEFEKEIQQSEKAMQKQMKKQKNWEIEF